MILHFAWPQVVWVAAWLLGLGLKFNLHGKPIKYQRYNAVGPIIVSLGSMALLILGGFFG